MNLYLAEMLDKPDALPDHCVVCGRTSPLNAHHVIPGDRKNPRIPRLRLCGSGTQGCHGDTHAKKLHFRYRDGWEYIRTTPMKYEVALTHEAYWDPIREGESA